MTMTSVVPIIAVVAFLLFSFTVAVGGARGASSQGWLAAIVTAAAFLLFSVYAGIEEGPLGFWPEHTRNLWGNQIWLDLLLMASVAWVVIVPRARAAGMSPAPWLLLVIATGSFGMLVMLGRLLLLERRR